MNENVDLGHEKFVKITFFSVLGIFSVLLVIIVLTSMPLRSKASTNTLSLKIKIQGTYKAFDKIKARVAFYDGPDKASEEPEVEFIYQSGVLNGDVAFQSGFNFAKPYALFIKPVNFVGRIFCSAELSGDKCKTPAFFFLTSGSSADLTSQTFLGGDLTPPNGKVDAQDLSYIIKNLGKVTTDATQNTDLNGDGITDVVDYSLAFYSLSNNAEDDKIELTAPIQPTVTPSVIPSLSPTDQPTPTASPSATPSPTIDPTITVTVTPTATPSATITPTPVNIR
ncbi:MAG: dockerin type I domain-containing protein [Patescibacteria group bacterium]